MGIFDLFKKKEEKSSKEENKILLAMPMFNNGESYKLNEIIDHLKNYWGLTVSEITGDDKTSIFEIDGERVAIAYIPVQIPWGDVKNSAQYAYNWMTAEKDLENHNAHALVTLMGKTKTIVERFIILSKLLHSIFKTSNAIGVLQGGESLLIPRDQYLEMAEGLKQDQLPVLLWVYIGLMKSEQLNNVYTYGLFNFGKLEMEIINSSLGLEELHGLLANVTLYVIEHDITFNSGETLGYTQEQKVKITQSKGRFVDGKSLKLAI